MVACGEIETVVSWWVFQSAKSGLMVTELQNERTVWLDHASLIYPVQLSFNRSTHHNTSIGKRVSSWLFRSRVGMWCSPGEYKQDVICTFCSSHQSKYFSLAKQQRTDTMSYDFPPPVDPTPAAIIAPKPKPCVPFVMMILHGADCVRGKCVSGRNWFVAWEEWYGRFQLRDQRYDALNQKLFNQLICQSHVQQTVCRCQGSSGLVCLDCH